jgi:hypothetical protein
LKATSERKIRANRANAGASTGPKSTLGRTRSARNALRHSLSLPVYSDKALSQEVEALARQIAGTEAGAEMQELARRVAEAQIDVRRVRHARHQLLSQPLSSRAEWGLFRRLRDAAADAPIAGPVEYVTTMPEGPHKLATVLSEKVRQPASALATQICGSCFRSGAAALAVGLVLALLP